MDEEAKNFLKKCIEMYSPSGQEKEFSEFLAEFLRNNGFSVNFDSVGNLIAEKGTGKPFLLLISHMDTIPGELPIKEEEGKIYGRGAVDCKPSLAAMVYSICQYDFDKVNACKVVFAGIVREEESMIGIEEFIKSDIQPDVAIYGEPTGIKQICIGYKGRIGMGYRVLTEKGHVANSWEYVNAIEIALEVWKMIKGVCWHLTESLCPKNEKTRYYNRIIPNLTIISGGQITNSIPSECVIQVDIRFPPMIDPQNLLGEIRKKVLGFKRAYQDQCKIKFQIQENLSSFIDAFEINRNEPVVGALRWAIFKNINEKSKLIKRTGTTFINAIAIKYRIPSITYGPGNVKLEHTDEEFIEVDEYLKSIDIYLKLYDKYSEMFHKKSAS